MKNIVTAFAIATAVLLAGCGVGTSGGPGATDPPTAPGILGQAHETFSLSVPSAILNQGDSKPLTIGIHRGQNFGQDVSLKFGALPKGITLTPASAQIKHGDSNAEFSLMAANDAALGSFTISVTGQPSRGATAAGEMKLSVEPYDAEAEAAAIDDAAQERMDERILSMETGLERLAAEYEALKARADNATGQAKAELDLQVERARIHYDNAKNELDEIKPAAASAWQRVKDGVARAFDEE
jgi:hypothetical protein